MTKSEAIKRARKLYGDKAHVEHVPGSAVLAPYRIGWETSFAIHLKGLGNSWEEAIKDAERKVKSK